MDIKKVPNSFLSLKRHHKKIVAVLADLVVLPLALLSAFSLRFSELYPKEQIEPFWWMFIVFPVLGVFIFLRLGLYHAVIRFMGSQAIFAIIKGVGILGLLMYATAYLIPLIGFPRSIPINFVLVSAIYIGGTRFIVRSYYHWLRKHFTRKEVIIIYGAGAAGTQLAASLVGGNEFYPIAFIDDDKTLHGHLLQGVKVYSKDEVEELVYRYDVSRILLALPSATKVERKSILDRLAPYPVHVQTIPSFEQVVSGKVEIGQLQEVELDDLLGRDPVMPDQDLFAANIKDKVVMVTGAGGSIGSELCRQIVTNKPRELILYEISEFALYTIEQEIINKYNVDIQFYSILGSVNDKERVESIIKKYHVQTIYHAAAYKHVPLVEHNIYEGVNNNILGTKTVALAAHELDVENFILISTDKAVRPTNVMGATKRVAELVLQSLANEDTKTIFTMVRFGNVLGSSGSVVPLFRRQIEEGGPITVTHKDIVRYFMSIPEAAQLVIQAGAMSEGGDVFVLDMGEPVKIIDLASRMVQLSGLQLKDDEHPDGDIEISVTGLRPGEKLYEELLIGDNVVGTIHPRIMRALEESLAKNELDKLLSEIVETENTHDYEMVRNILALVVKDYTPSVHIVDHLQASNKNLNPNIVQINK